MMDSLLVLLLVVLLVFFLVLFLELFFLFFVVILVVFFYVLYYVVYIYVSVVASSVVCFYLVASSVVSFFLLFQQHLRVTTHMVHVDMSILSFLVHLILFVRIDDRDLTVESEEFVSEVQDELLLLVTVVLADIEFSFSEDGVALSLGASNDSQVHFLFLDLLIINIELRDQGKLMLEMHWEFRFSVNFVGSDALVISLAFNDECVAFRGLLGV